MNGFCVLGSLNMDLVTRVERFPRPGETLQGQSFQIFPGGKGANQAVALARLGAKVELVGARGLDSLGSSYDSVLRQAGVDVAEVALVEDLPTGTATILVNAQGENVILIVAGANGSVTPAFVESHRASLARCSTLLLQLEVPLESVLLAARLAKQAGTRVILDPAPARELPEELYRWVDIITPNETEAAILTGVDTGEEAGIRRAAESLRNRGVGIVIVKAGARGAYRADERGFTRVPGFSVPVVDTVAAGDSFNAGLAYALGAGQALDEAIRFANAVAGLATTKEGAQSAMPTLDEVRVLVGPSPKSP